MDLLLRTAQVIVPVFFIVAIGFADARRRQSDLRSFNRIVQHAMTPLLVYTALAGKAFRLQGHESCSARCPPAVLRFLLAERYGQEPERVAAMILLGNALAMLFIPLGLAPALPGQ